MVRNMASKLAMHPIGKNWSTRFIKDNANKLQSWFSRQLDANRARAADPELLQDFFDLFYVIVLRNRILNQNIWNMDESGFMMGYAASSKVVVPAGKRNSHLVTQDGGRNNVTVVECVSAAGCTIPPMLILNGQYHGYATFSNQIHALLDLHTHDFS